MRPEEDEEGQVREYVDGNRSEDGIGEQSDDTKGDAREKMKRAESKRVRLRTQPAPE